MGLWGVKLSLMGVDCAVNGAHGLYHQCRVDKIMSGGKLIHIQDKNKYDEQEAISNQKKKYY